MTNLDSVLRGHLWPVVVVVGLLAIALNGGRLSSTRWMDARFDPQRMPVAAVSFVEQSALRGPVLSPDYWGGYLIYRLFPHNRVVIDDRHDFYGESFLRSYLAAMHLEPRWEDFLEVHSACLVLPKKTALSTILGKSPEWKTVYSDEVAVVFVTSQIPEDRDRAPSQ